MACDIIIPVWDQLEFTRDCVDSILKNTTYPYRLILVDNASGEETANYLENLKNRKEISAKITVIRNDTNAGFIKAVNQGLKISSAEYVCVLNNDTIPAPGWLRHMVRFAETHDDVGLVNPQCDGHGSMSIEEYAKSLERNDGIYMEMNQCQGFAMLIKRALLEKIGYLDEDFGIGGFDDTDYSMRAHKAGYKSVCIYDAYVYHRLHGSFDKAGNRQYWVRRNQKLYYDKWGKHLRAGVSATLENNDSALASDLIRFAYGLAREWTWVHLWINSKAGAFSAQKKIEGAIRDNGYPLHQNIRIQYFNLPAVLFKAMTWGKYIERALNPRMRNKRFDSIFDFNNGSLQKFFTRTSNWEKAGKVAAESLQTHAM